MVLVPRVQKAFDTIGISPSTTYEDARTIYKKLALEHHPDRNFGDVTATIRFRQIGEAWDICQKHFETPQQPPLFYPMFDFEEDEANFYYKYYDSDGDSYGIYYDDDDDGEWEEEGEDDSDYDLNTEDKGEEESLADSEADLSFRYVFEEVVFGRYTSSRGEEYRQNFRTAPTPDGGQPQPQNTGNKSQNEDQRRQQAKNEAYQERIHELEREIAAEKAEKKRQAKEQQRPSDQTATLQHLAFALGRTGDFVGMRNMIELNGLDVEAPEKLGRHRKTKPEDCRHETMLHVAAMLCKDTVFLDFLTQKGADPGALNFNSLSPFHAAILSENASSVNWFLQKRVKQMQGCHPSKAAPDGRTPLQLAITSGNVEIIRLVVKDATVHDVEKCWKGLDQQLDEVQRNAIREILTTKRGFHPPLRESSLLNAENQQKSSRKKKAKRKKNVATS